MAAHARRYHLFTRDPRRPGLPVVAATGIPEANRATLARAWGAPTIFADVVDMERADTDIRGADGAPAALPDATLAAYRLLLSLDRAPLKRLRFTSPGGEIEVQGEYFRSVSDSQVWREARPPAIRPLQTPDLGHALGPLMGLRREEILGATWLDPGDAPPVVAVLLSSLQALAGARVGAGAAAWVRAHGDATQPFRFALFSAEGTSPLSDGHLRLLSAEGEALAMDGTAAACGLVAHWHRTPRQMALTAEVGDGRAAAARLSVWVEGEVGAPERLSIAGHVREGEALQVG